MLYGILAAFVVFGIAADQISKYLITQHYFEQYSLYIATHKNIFCEPIPVLDGVFHLTFVGNDGMAFSMLEGGRWFFLVLTVAALIFIGITVWKKWIRHPVGLWSLALIATGAIGNLIDRIRLGFVVDMIEVEFMNFAVFNVADSFVVCGAILLVIYTFFFDKPQKETSHDTDAGQE